MCYIASTIAGYFIEKSNAEQSPLSVLQIIKLVYISHGWNLALNNQPLISDKIEAWKYGPVMPSLHKLFEGQGLIKDEPVKSFLIEESSCIKQRHWPLLNKVYAQHKHYTGDQLSELMHEQDTPWFIVWDNGEGKDNQIKDEDTKAYYSKKINKELYESYSEIPSVESRDEAILFLKKAGILMDDGELNPIYRNS